jgi:hypothetical protein
MCHGEVDNQAIQNPIYSLSYLNSIKCNPKTMPRSFVSTSSVIYDVIDTKTAQEESKYHVLEEPQNEGAGSGEGVYEELEKHQKEGREGLSYEVPISTISAPPPAPAQPAAQPAAQQVDEPLDTEHSTSEQQ